MTSQYLFLGVILVCALVLVMFMFQFIGYNDNVKELRADLKERGCVAIEEFICGSTSFPIISGLGSINFTAEPLNFSEP